jgi:hypothetical protein
MEKPTIAALATPRGRGGVAVIRVSGPDAFAIASSLSARDVSAKDAGRFFHCRFRDGVKILDDGLLLVFAVLVEGRAVPIIHPVQGVDAVDDKVGFLFCGKILIHSDRARIVAVPKLRPDKQIDDACIIVLQMARRVEILVHVRISVGRNRAVLLRHPHIVVDVLANAVKY